MTLAELITDLKAAGANENTLRLAMNCYQLGREEVVYAGPNEFVQIAIDCERKACEQAVYAAYDETGSPDAYRCVEAVRARGQQ